MKENTMKIDKDLCMMVSLALGYIAENCELNETAYNKVRNISLSMQDYLKSDLGNNDSPEQVIDELIKNISSIQEKIDAYDDLEYSEDEYLAVTY